MRSFFWNLAILLICLCVTPVLGQAQQVIGAFPTMDGGLENQTAGNLGSTLSTTAWSSSSSTNTTRTLNTTGGRSGPKYVTYGFTPVTGTSRLQSPSPAVPTNTMYTVQFYYKTSGATAATNMRAGVGVNGTANNAYTSITLNGTSGVWTKVTAQVNQTLVAGTAGMGIIQANTGGMGSVTIDVDDFVMYPATSADVTAPNAPTSPSIPSPGATQLAMSWTAPAGGVDSGGYMVVRGLADPTTTPNANGIYAVGNTIAAGEQVVYIGTSTSFTDVGLTPLTPYYYRIYAVDKAFNYSSAATLNATTAAPSYASEPTVQASGINFSGLSSTGMTINWTNGDGTNRIVIVRSGSAVSGTPSDGGSYTANSVFGSGSLVGSGNYVVYNGTSNSVAITGLTKATAYYVAIYEFNGSSGTENYLTSSSATGNKTSLPREVFSNGTSSGGAPWGTTTTWSTSQVPDAGDNVNILAGDKIQVGATNNCYNLRIAATGKLYNNTALPTSSIQYLTVNGDSVIVDGTYGDKIDLGTADCAIGINFNSSLRITGSGLIRPARIRPNTNTTNATLTIDANLECTYTGSGGTGGAGLYTSNSGNDNITVTINSGKTLSFVSFSNLSVGSSTDSGACNTTFNVNGTVNIQGNGNLSLRNGTGKLTTLNVNGTVNVGRAFYTTSANGVLANIVVTSPGVLTCGTGGSWSSSPDADFTSPSQIVTGTGSFALGTGARILIGSPAGITSSGATGPIQTSTRTFPADVSYSYVGTAAQVTGSGLPASLRTLVINNSAGVTLTNSVKADTGISMTLGTLSTGANVLELGALATAGRTSGWVVGTIKRDVDASWSGVSKSFYLGTASYFTPTFLTFGTVTGSGDITGTTTTGDHPNLSTSTIVPSRTVNRYVTLTNNGVAFDSYGATFHFNPAEVDAGALPANFLVGKYNAGTWSTPNVSSYSDTTVSVSSVTSFSDFAFGQPKYTLSVVSGGNGSVTKTADSTGYNPGTVVSVSATPNAHYHFLHWVGDVPSGQETTNPVSITMDANKSITGSFAIDAFTITSGVVGNGTITPTGSSSVNYGSDNQYAFAPATGHHLDSVLVDGVKVDSTSSYTFITVAAAHSITTYFSPNFYTLGVSGSNGSVAKSPDQASYSYDSTVQLTATPDAGFTFVNWTGDVPSGQETVNPLTITMDANKSLVAHFAADVRTITSSVVGSGSITPNGATSVTAGINQTFTFAPATGHHLDSLLVDGDRVDTATTSYTFVDVQTAHSITAYFSINSYAVSVATVGSGSVAKSPDQPTYTYGTNVTITATPATGWHFTGWSGDATGSTNPLTYAVGTSNSITATFAIDQHTLTVNASNGSVTKNPNQTTFNYGDQVILTPMPASGYSFSSWTGVPVGHVADNPLTVTVTSDTAVTANFTINTYAVTVNTVGSGSVTKSPDLASYAYNDTVRLTATANAGSHFTGWSGDLTGSTNPVTITITAARTITATFASNGNVRRTRGLDSVWSSVNNWEYGQLPVSTDTVEILAGDTTRFDVANATVAAIRVYGGFRPSRTLATALTVTGDFNFYPGSVCYVNTSQSGAELVHNYTVQGNLNFNGVQFDCRTGSAATLSVVNWLFTGSGNSTLTVNQSYSPTGCEFNGITVNKQGSGRLILGSDIFLAGGSTATPTANSYLYLTRGLVQTDSHALIHLSTSSTTTIGGSDSSYVIGAMGRGMSSTGTASRDYPLGDATGYHPIKVYSATAGGGTGHYVIAREIQGNANTGSSVLVGGIGKVSQQRYFKMTYGFVNGAGGSPTSTMDLLNLAPYYSYGDGFRAGNTNLRVAYSIDDRATWSKINWAVPNTTKPDSLPRLLKPDSLTSWIHLDAGTGNAVYAALADTGGFNPLDGTTAGATVSPKLFAFGSVTTQATKVDSFMVNSNGTGLMTVLSAVADSASECTVSPAGPVHIPTGSSAKFYITFHPSTGGVKSGNVIVKHDAPAIHDTIVVGGTGVQLYTLTINTTHGTVSMSPDQAFYNAGDSVTLTPTPASGYAFSGWTGAVTSSANPLKFAVDSNMIITANFIINEFAVNVAVVGSGSVTKNPDQATYIYGSTVQLTAVPVDLSWKFSTWSGDTTAVVNPITIPVTSARAITATFVRDSAYLATYRSFNPDSIGLSTDNFGKSQKLVTRKPAAVDFSFSVTMPQDGGLNLTIGVMSSGVLTVGSDTIATWDMSKTASSVVPLLKDQVVNVFGRGYSGKALKSISYTVTGASSVKGKITSITSTLRTAMPNRLNALYETMAAGAYGTGGLVVGYPQSKTLAAFSGWFQSTKWADVAATLANPKAGKTQSGTAHGFDVFLNAKPVVKQQKKLAPDKYDSRLLGNLIGLKLSIAGSQMGMTPRGFGELLYHDAGSAYNGMMLKDIAAKGDTLMMGWLTDTTIKGKASHLRHFADAASFVAVDTVIGKVLAAFEGSVDTVKFADTLRFKGVTALVNVPFLSANPGVAPAAFVPVAGYAMDEQMPETFSLYQNYPNPFNPTTTIQFALPNDALVSLKVYNLLGQEVATLLDKSMLEAGVQEAQFNAQHLASGVYFYRIMAENVNEDGNVQNTFQMVKKMVLVK